MMRFRSTITTVSPLLLTLLAISSTTWAQSYLLKDARQTGDQQAVKATLQVRGKIQMEDAEQDSNVDLAASAQVAYQEALIANPSTATKIHPVESARYYSVAKAKLRVGEHNELVKLNESGQWVMARTGRGNSLASVQVPLSRPELEMLTLPGNSLVAYQLLPGTSVAEGETWTHADESIAAVLNLDEVTVNETRSRLIEVKQGLARMQITGSVSGHIDGAASRLRISGDYRYDLNWKHITWLQLVVEEQRETSPTHPGFNVRAEMKMLAEPIEGASRLTQQVLDRMIESVPQRGSLLRFESLEGGYRLIHDVDWHVRDDRAGNTHLRLVTDGKTVAQCNIRRLKQRIPQEPLSLTEFKSGVIDALGERYGDVVTSREWQRQDQYNVLKVVVAGAVDKIPIQWVYYHLSSPAGHCAAYVYTMEQNSAESFAEYDSMMVNSLKLAEVPETKRTQDTREQARRSGKSRTGSLKQVPRL